ncbi:MAG: M55 family metallopeptidase [Candidatus Eremiobacteraeota bacterium]|nr:M55 family metallopeptidase [Candidatus Eremiobacteraeota bacterium]
MKLYISCDMEGVAGVSSWEQVDARTREYGLYQRYMTNEVRAAVDGARAAGASDVLINDSHGSMRNLLFDGLPDDIRVIFGNRKPLSMSEGLDSSFAGVLYTGYHGGVGDANATLCHTYTPSVVYDVRVNGIRCSEATLNAGVAGYFGVPVLMITGDRATIESAKAQMPWITGVVIKESIGNYCVDSVSPQRACELIHAGAREAMGQIDRARPFVFEPPISLDLDVAKVEQADWIELIPGFVRTDARSVRFTHDDYTVVFRAFVAAFRLGYQAGLSA